MTTATVETMTAEVRVLMVGNRQITMSIAKQLDRVHLSNLEIFGRVNISKDALFVIGKSKSSGALSLAQYQRPDLLKTRLWFDDSDALRVGWQDDERVTLCWAVRQQHEHGFRLLSRTGRPYELDASLVRRCGMREHGYHAAGDAKCEQLVQMSDKMHHQIEAHLHEQLAERESYKAMCSEASEAPLIVLAGLR